jgi:predicted flap endonuclease-1-like 5' DNA nuclease
MRDALYAAGITTYAKLGASTEAELQAAIEAAGMRLSRNLDTWPAQARELAGS